MNVISIDSIYLPAKRESDLSYDNNTKDNDSKLYITNRMDGVVLNSSSTLLTESPPPLPPPSVRTRPTMSESPPLISDLSPPPSPALLEESPSRSSTPSSEVSSSGASRGPGRKRRSSGPQPPRIKNELDTLPYSAPAQVFRNVLIVEESLRQQYATLVVSRRKHVLFFSLLVLATFYFSYSVFVATPSAYVIMNFIHRVGFIASLVNVKVVLSNWIIH